MNAAPRLRRAFSLTELLVVLVIIVILLGIAIPAFRSMSQSQEKTSSEARLGFALSAARDAAVTAGEGNDVAAVFVYELGGPMRVVPCRVAGRLLVPTGNASAPQDFEILTPVSTIEPTSLPPGWTVRAYAPGATIGGGWYDDGATARYTPGQPAWVFPETGFFDHTIANDGQNRQTFMVRFEGGTGKLVGVSPRPALVVLPRPSSDGRTLPDYARVDLAPDLRQFVETVLTDPRLSTAERSAAIGPNSGDVVLAKPVSVLALVDESALAGALGVRIDEASRCLYAAPEADVRAGLRLAPQLVPGPTGGAPVPTLWVDRAIEFYANPQGSDNARVTDREVRLYTIDRYSGALRELPVAPQ